MSSAVAATKIFSRDKITMYVQNPADTTADYVAWVDMSTFESFAAIAMASVLTGAGVTAFSLYCADDSAGTNATLIKSHALATPPSTAGFYVGLECIADEIMGLAGAGRSLKRWVSAKITKANNSDNISVVYILSHCKFPADALYVDKVA